MKHILLIASLALSLTSCSKDKELSQEEQERKEPLAPNQIIENEHGGLRFLITNGSMELKAGVPVFVTEPFVNYYIEADKMPQNSTTELWFAGAGTFDLEVEGFTAMPTTKRFKVTGLNSESRFRLHKGIVRYTFTQY